MRRAGVLKIKEGQTVRRLAPFNPGDGQTVDWAGAFNPGGSRDAGWPEGGRRGDRAPGQPLGDGYYDPFPIGTIPARTHQLFSLAFLFHCAVAFSTAQSLFPLRSRFFHCAVAFSTAQSLSGRRVK